MTTYVYDRARGIMVNRDTREPMNPEPVKGKFPLPGVVSDIAPYLSPIDGRYIGGKAAKRDDLARNNCIDAADFPPQTDLKLRNRKFAKKHGLEGLLHEEAK